MSKKVGDHDADAGAAAASGNKEMKGLVAAAAMMACDGEGAGGKRKPDETQAGEAVASSGKAAPNATADRGAPSTPGEAMAGSGEAAQNATADHRGAPSTPSGDGGRTKDVSAARARRLEQNRRAAIESRRRKKVMIEELQRSVTFYTKANETLKADNGELERRLYLAKQRVMQAARRRAAGEAPAGPASLKAPPEPCERPTEPRMRSIPCGPGRNEEGRHRPVAPAGAHPPAQSASPVQSDRTQAQLTATQAIYETMGYSSAAARVAASTFSQFVGITGSTPSVTNATSVPANPPDASLDMKPSATAPGAAQLPTEEEVGSENYVESLQKFAMQQTAAANAAAAAANAAIQALNWHKMMKSNDGTNPQPVVPTAPASYAPPFPMPPISNSAPNAAAPTRSAHEEEERPPPIKKRKL